MRRFTWLGLVAVLALAGTSIAVAAKRADKGTATLAFAVSASAGDSAKSRTCEGVDGTYVQRSAVYRGTATGGLAGNAVVRVTSTVNTDEGSGSVKGQLVVRDADDKLKARANLTGVVAGGSVDGFLTGRAVESGKRGRLLGNFSGSLSDGSLSLAVGSGSGSNSAIVFGGTGCRKAKPAAARTVRGTVESVTSVSITVKPSNGDAVTCSLTAAQAAAIERRGIEAGDTVQIACRADGDGLRLAKVQKRG